MYYELIVDSKWLFINSIKSVVRQAALILHSWMWTQHNAVEKLLVIPQLSGQILLQWSILVIVTANILSVAFYFKIACGPIVLATFWASLVVMVNYKDWAFYTHVHILVCTHTRTNTSKTKNSEVSSCH